MEKKRIALIILFFVITILLGYAIYRVFFSSGTDGSITTEDGTSTSGVFPTADDGSIRSDVPFTDGSLPFSDGGTDFTGTLPQDDSAAAPIVSQITDQPVGNISAGNLGTAKFYNEVDGKFYTIGPDGKPIPLSDTTFFNVSDVSWSPTREEAIIEYPDGANIYYNFDTKKQVTLPRHWEEFSFQNAGNKIAAKSIGFSEENKWLIVADPDGNNMTPIEPLGQNANRVIVDWSPGGQVLALSRTGEPLGSDRQEVLLIGQYGENFKSIIVEGRDLRTTWSPEGNTILHSVYSSRSDYKPELWVVGASGDNIGAGRKLLDVRTWADKCAFADDRYVYCGVPTSIAKGTGFVPALSDTTPDDLIRIDTQTGLKQPIQTDGINTIESMYIGDNGSTLYFTDKNKPGLYSVSL